ncbi:hypothetical protein QYE76_016409 [Lolium multiflorum]|uniref:Uncharacterized protein n=1 Tax=Lolium multiflorum TaxID=4521 RepID=A0AAD8VCL8_LOLMU|nr:hypothetical protein QYE76_016409 [Lolium multiflorum]
MGANGRADSPSSTKTPPRGGATGGELYSPSAKSPRAGSLSSLLPTGLAASLFDRRWAISGAVTVFLFIVATLTVTSTSSSSASFFLLPVQRQRRARPASAGGRQRVVGPAAASPRRQRAAAGVPRLGLQGRPGPAVARAARALPPAQPLRGAPGPRGARGERLELARRVANSTVFRRVGNVEVIRRANMVTYRGPTMVANTLHACAMLLRRSRDWDWFINLSASDYPLMTQDDILHAFSALPRNVNFIEHTGYLGWKESQREATDRGPRAILLPEAGHLLCWADPAGDADGVQALYGVGVGGAVAGLRRVRGVGVGQPPAHPPLYYANFISSPEGYFQTVLCNAPASCPPSPTTTSTTSSGTPRRASTH